MSVSFASRSPWIDRDHQEDRSHIPRSLVGAREPQQRSGAKWQIWWDEYTNIACRSRLAIRIAGDRMATTSLQPEGPVGANSGQNDPQAIESKTFPAVSDLPSWTACSSSALTASPCWRAASSVLACTAIDTWLASDACCWASTFVIALSIAGISLISQALCWLGSVCRMVATGRRRGGIRRVHESTIGSYRVAGRHFLTLFCLNSSLNVSQGSRNRAFIPSHRRLGRRRDYTVNCPSRSRSSFQTARQVANSRAG